MEGVNWEVGEGELGSETSELGSGTGELGNRMRELEQETGELGSGRG